MDISFQTNKIKKLVSSKKKLFKKFGNNRLCEDILSRLRDIEVAENLLVIKNMSSARLHKLKGDREWQLAIDVDGKKEPRRIIFKCNNWKEILKDWYNDKCFEKVISVEIIDIGDPYHD